MDCVRAAGQTGAPRRASGTCARSAPRGGTGTGAREAGRAVRREGIPASTERRAGTAGAGAGQAGTRAVAGSVEPPPVDGPPGIEVPQVEDPEFYPARMLDRFPKPVADVELRYPDQAGSEDLSGTVTLLLLIDELGMVVKASVVEADPPGYFEEAAIEAFRSILFTPAERDGKVVKSRLVVQVSFDAKTDSMRK
jgi:periplasmic protein TonB